MWIFFLTDNRLPFINGLDKNTDFLYIYKHIVKRNSHSFLVIDKLTIDPIHGCRLDIISFMGLIRLTC